MENFDLVCLACNCLDENEGKDILVVDTRKVPNLVEYVVFVSANDYAHVATIAEKVTTLMAKKNIELLQREGFGMADWIALDFGAFFIHIFTKDVREKYNIEKLVVDGKNSKKFEAIKKEAQKVTEKQLKTDKDTKKVVKKEDKLSTKTVEKNNSKIKKTKKENKPSKTKKTNDKK